MTTARQHQIHLESTPYYHCISRCVRRAFLYGEDKFTGRNFDHRKQWIVDRLQWLSSLFAIDICAYAVMSNHYHLVLHVDADQARQWDDIEIICRWSALFSGSLAAKVARGEVLVEDEDAALNKSIRKWRERLTDISWFMRCLNEPLARQANGEDECSGRFWEGRFKSQALLGEGALFACMAYVDLNPIRAGVAKTLETSDFTSIQARIRDYRKTLSPNKAIKAKKVEMPSPDLLPCAEDPTVTHKRKFKSSLPITYASYLELVDWTGRVLRHDKKGAIPAHITPILQQLGLNEAQWLPTVSNFQKQFYRVAGPADAMRAWCKRIGQCWLKGIHAAGRIYSIYKPLHC